MAWSSIGTRAIARSVRNMAFPLGNIESIFQGPVSVFPDPEHSGEEERFIGIGKTEKHHSVFVVFTLRRKDDVVLIRPISARFMHKKEIDYYEKETSKTEKRRGG
jgi:uncharacterized DUF497 family protein